MIAKLNRCFTLTKAFEEGDGLFGKCDVCIDDFRKRVPDFAYFTDSQIVAAAKGQKVYPAFVIEIISPKEPLRNMEIKLQDYFDAGVKLVWWILPTFKKIYAYTAINQVLIFTTGQTIIANPVLPDYEINIDQLFSID